MSRYMLLFSVVCYLGKDLGCFDEAFVDFVEADFFSLHDFLKVFIISVSVVSYLCVLSFYVPLLFPFALFFKSRPDANNGWEMICFNRVSCDACYICDGVFPSVWGQPEVYLCIVCSVPVVIVDLDVCFPVGHLLHGFFVLKGVRYD